MKLKYKYNSKNTGRESVREEAEMKWQSETKNCYYKYVIMFCFQFSFCILFYLIFFFSCFDCSQYKTHCKHACIHDSEHSAEFFVFFLFYFSAELSNECEKEKLLELRMFCYEERKQYWGKLEYAVVGNLCLMKTYTCFARSNYSLREIALMH